MAWLVKLMKDGKRLADAESFDAVHSAVQAGNSALRNGDADEVMIASRHHEAIYYQFSSVRTASEEQRMAQMLGTELAIAKTTI